MHSSNQSKILKQSDAEKVAFDFSPQKFPVVMPDQAKDFVQAEGSRKPTGFKINELVAEQIGVTANASKKDEERVEKLAIEKLKVVQEEAYKEAYELGEVEGRKDAYESVRAEYEGLIENFSILINRISELKKDLVVQNEAHIVKLVGAVASKLLMQQISANPDSIVPLVTSAVEDAQNEERVVIKLSPEDHQFISSLDEKFKKKFDNIKNLKFEFDDEITRGGCIVETNYGVIDATVEERINRLWESLEELAPAVKDQVG